MNITKAVKDYDRSDKTKPRALRWTVEVIIVVLIAAASFLVFETMEADAATAAPAAVAAAPEAKCDGSCPVAQKKRTQFVNHKIGNSGGTKMPKFIKKKMNAWKANNRPTANKAGTGDWWQDPLGASWCWAGLVQSTACFAGRPDIAEGTTKMVVVCSGAGVIGSVKGGGWWGVFKGAAGCGWGMWASNNAF